MEKSYEDMLNSREMTKRILLTSVRYTCWNVEINRISAATNGFSYQESNLLLL